MLDQFVTAEIFSFLLVFCRIGSAIMLLPGFGEAYVSARVRLLFALAFSLVLTPVLPALPALPASVPALVTLVAGEILIGLFLGGLARIIISALHIAGTIIAMQSSLASALVQDVTQIQGQASPIGNLLGMTALVLMFATNLHHILLEGLASSYITFTAGHFPVVEDMANHATLLMNGAFNAALRIAAPHVVIGIILYLGAGVVARLVPNIQIFFLLMAPQILISFFVLMITFSAIMMWFLDHFREAFSSLSQLN
jgi:flagellar biosynthetic protein FliR